MFYLNKVQVLMCYCFKMIVLSKHYCNGTSHKNDFKATVCNF